MARQSTFPVELILVRHGESEGNLAQKYSKKGDDRLWATQNFQARHTSRYRLTDKGRGQAHAAGEWIRQNIATSFDRYYCSEFLRAQETAALLKMPDATWNVESYLRERSTGVLAGRSKMQRERDYADEMRYSSTDSYYWCPPGGESIANACLRIDRFLDSLCVSSSGMRVLVVCHGNMMKAFRVRLERLTQGMYAEIEEEARVNPRAKIDNCQILHYSRRNPQSSVISGRLKWVRSINPVREEVGEWREIRRPTFSNAELLAYAKSEPQLLNDIDAARLEALDAEAATERERAQVEAEASRRLVLDHPLHTGVGVISPHSFQQDAEDYRAARAASSSLPDTDVQAAVARASAESSRSASPVKGAPSSLAAGPTEANVAVADSTNAATEHADRVASPVQEAATIVIQQRQQQQTFFDDQE
jgi:broad specificity phosphatase PhoE